MKSGKPTLLQLTAAACLALTASAAPVVISTTAPTVDGDDIANLVSTTSSLKWFSDIEHDAGQTFTPTATAQLTSFTIQLHAGNQDEGGEWVDLRLGTISRPGGVFTFTDVHSERADMNGDWNGGDYITFTFDTPQTVTAGVEYGIITDAHSFGDWHNGIPYIKKPGGYAGGHHIGRGGQGNSDLAFHLNLEHPMSPFPYRETVPGGSVNLTWTNLPPNTGSDVWVDVWFGTAPGSLTQYVDAEVDGLNATTVAVPAPVAGTYYWRIDSYLDGSPTGTPVEGDLFEFYVIDTDGDGFPDDYEIEHSGTNTGLNPGDDLENGGLGDGLTNWEEYQLGTDPNEPDSDYDGLLDGASITLGSGDTRYTEWAAADIAYSESGGMRTFRGESTMGTDPLNDDTDGDLLLDGIESNTGIWVDAVTDTGTSPTDADWDDDGLKDGVETKTGTLVDLATDTGTDPYLADSDSDGTGDWYEVATIDIDPLGPDPLPNTPNDPGLKPGIPYPLPDPDGSTGATDKPVKVYIMSGQSNMVGFGRVAGNGAGTLQTMTTVEGKFPNLVDGGGAWLARNDVLYRGVISAIGDNNLQPGFGANGASFGPELGFGHVMGWHHDEPVLLIKSSIGNRSLSWDCLPPGSPRFDYNGNTYAGYGDSPNSWPVGGSPSPFVWYAGKQYDDYFLDESDMGPTAWADATDYPNNCQVRHNGVVYISKTEHTSSPTSEPGVGAQSSTYWNVYSIFNVTDILDNFGAEYPQWAGQDFEIAGYVWWQGHKDQGEPHASRYEQNMVKFIKEIRDYYETRYPANTNPDAPFVLATIAFGGWGLSGDGLTVANGQLAVSGETGNYPEFAGNVKTMEARGYWRDSGPSGQGFHYNHNAETYMLTGDALGRAMVELLDGGTTPTDYETWALDYPGADLTNPNADYDGDGLTNDEERIWGLNPTSGASVNPISAPLDATAGTLSYTRRNPALTGIAYSYEWSTTLAPGTWTSFTPATETPDAASPVETVEITLGAGLLANPELFVRVVAN